MLARTVRSGVVEAVHAGTVVAVDASGEVLARWGDPERPFFVRSAVKPIQGAISEELGGDLEPTARAVACASHHAEPIHVAYVSGMLAAAGLTEEHLRCPPVWPSSLRARDRLISAGEQRRRPIYHNCSGKHAAMLRACAAQGWDVDSYTSPDHPLQVAMMEAVGAASREDPGPVGIDGCGVPTFQATTTGLARVFAAIGFEPRFRRVAEAMHRYPSLTSGTRAPEAAIPRIVHGVAKGGAMGCIGVAVLGQVAVAAKAYDGTYQAAVVGAVAALRALGFSAETSSFGVAGVERIPVHGGGAVVGHIEPAIDELVA